MDQQFPQPRTRVEITDLYDKIIRTDYARVEDTTMTLCVLHLKNGHTVIGKSACVDPKQFNQALGEKYSFEDAINNLWPLEGYLLQEDIYRNAQNNAAAAQFNPEVEQPNTAA